MNNDQLIFVMDNFILKQDSHEVVRTHKNKIIECIKNNGFTGKQIHEMNRKTFGKTIHEFVGQKKLNGPLMKIHKNISNFDVHKLSLPSIIPQSVQQVTESVSITISDHEQNDDKLQQTEITCLEQCDNEQVLEILRNCNGLNEGHLMEYKQQIIEYFEKEHIDGKKINSMKRKEFGGMIIMICDNNKKMNGPSVKLWKEVTSFDFQKLSLTEVNTPTITRNTTLIGNDPYTVDEIKQCNHNELIYLLDKYIFKEIDNEKLNENKSLILTYFEDNNVSGEQVMNMKRKEFISNINTHIDTRKLNGVLPKLYKALQSIDTKNFKIPSVIKTKGVELNEVMEEKTEMPKAKRVSLTKKKNNELIDMSNEQITYALKHEILPQINDEDDKVSQNMDLIIRFIKLHKWKGKDIIAMTRIEFAKQLAEFCEDSQLNLILMSIYDNLHSFEWNNIPKVLAASPLSHTPSSIKECNVEQLIGIMNTHILPQIPELVPHKDKINAYFIENELNGDKFTSMDRKKFGQDMVDELGDKKFKGRSIKLYGNLSKYKFTTGKKINFNDMPSLSTNEIALSISTEKLSRNKSNASAVSLDSVASYDNLTCDIIAQMARDNAVNSLSMTHKKIQKTIIQNKITGKIFINKCEAITNSDNNTQIFIKFFNEQICGGRKSGKSNKKFEKFRNWLMNEVKYDIDIIKEHDVNEFAKFILDGYDEFIAHLFVLENIDGANFMSNGSRTIANNISNKYNVPRGGITNLCASIDDKLKNDVARYTQNKVAKSKRWCSKKSTRFLPDIDLEMDENDEDDIKENQKQVFDDESWIDITMDQFIEIIKKVIFKINKKKSCDIKIEQIINEVKKTKMNGRMFKFNTNKTFSSKLKMAGIDDEYHQIIYNKIRNFDLSYFSNKDFIAKLTEAADELNTELQSEYINKTAMIICIESQNMTRSKFDKMEDDDWINLLKPCNIQDSINKLLLRKLRSFNNDNMKLVNDRTRSSYDTANETLV